MAKSTRIKSAQPVASESRHRWQALALAGLVAGMVGLSFAAVPLYRIFCQVTGFGGTTQRAEQAPDKILDRMVTVRLDANIAKGMPWRFEPVQNEIELKLGESVLAFYQAQNLSDETVHGTATFNVTPEIVGSYFNKIECFCFTEQALEGRQRVDMPVNFFIDPEMLDDPDARNVTEITLSYTFFPVEKEADVASKRSRPGKDRDGS